MAGAVNGGICRRVCLHQNLSVRKKAAGPTRHLRYKAESLFRRPKVRQVERRVGQNHSDQFQRRKVKPLRYHLRSKQNVVVAFFKGGDFFLKLALFGNSVGVKTQGAGVWKF